MCQFGYHYLLSLLALVKTISYSCRLRNRNDRWTTDDNTMLDMFTQGLDVAIKSFQVLQTDEYVRSLLLLRSTGLSARVVSHFISVVMTRTLTAQSLVGLRYEPHTRTRTVQPRRIDEVKPPIIYKKLECIL